MDYSRQIKCNNSQGGNSKVYLFPYVEYLDSEITVVNNVLTSFPNSIVYDMNAVNINFILDAKQDNDIEYSEKISFQLKKLSENDKFKEYLQQDYRIIIKDNNGKYRLFGLQNGLLGSYKEESGTNRNEFSGYSFNFEGKEENTAPYLTNLSFFNIVDVAITEVMEKTYNTYAEMILAGVDGRVSLIRVLVDENKGINNTTYLKYADGTILWVASTEDN